MLMCNGNGEDIGQSDPYELSRQFHTNICTFDYSCYGLHSNSNPSVNSSQSDVETVYQYLVDEKNIHPRNIVIYGRSLGTYVSCYLSSIIEETRCKLILVSHVSS